MTRLIDANKLKMYIDTCQFCEKCPNIAFMCQRSCEFPNILTPQWERAIDEQPTVNALPVRHGKWIPVTNGRGGFECDQCHCYAPSYQDGVEWLSAFCPNCGARMDEE